MSGKKGFSRKKLYVGYNFHFLDFEIPHVIYEWKSLTARSILRNISQDGSVKTNAGPR